MIETTSIGLSTTTSQFSAPHISFDNLYSAILQCFVIILFGYIGGRVGLVTSTQGAGIGSFVAKFCLPALLFQGMCELDFSEVNWKFLTGILISKASLFLFISIITLLVKRPLNLGYAGLFSIFTTQSNDFALGYPIFEALYGSTHPEYLKYLYLIAPISLVVLNPIGFIMMEVHRHKSRPNSQSESGYSKAAWHVFKGVISNPIVFMTTIGLVGNFVFSGKIPYILKDILQVLGQAYKASALFYLGLSLVGKISSQLGLALIVPVLLITAKTILLPLITWEVIGLLETTENSTQAFSMYGFLYGTIPTAPSVFLYSVDYGLAESVVATGLVLGTLLSAPLMFVSARMMTVLVEKSTDYKNMLLKTSFDISIISLICCIWVICIFIASGKWKRVPHRFTVCLMFAHMCACIGMITFDSTDMTSWRHYPIYILLLVGVFATRCWTAVIAVILCTLHLRSLCFVLRHQVWFYFAGFGLPIVVTGLVFLVGSHNLIAEINPDFHYGTLQAIFSIIILGLSTIVTVASIIMWQRMERHSQSRSRTTSFLHEDESSQTPCDASDDVSQPTGASSLSSPSKYDSIQCNDYQPKKSVEIEDIVPFPRASNIVCDDDNSSLSSTNYLIENVSERTCLLEQCDTEQRHACMDRLRRYTATVAINDESSVEEDISSRDQIRAEYQTVHHLILLLLLQLSMIIGLFVCSWRIAYNKPTGIYVEIEFLDCVFNYGQGFFILIIFGFDTHLVFSPMIRRLRRLIVTKNVNLPSKAQLDNDVVQTCQQFMDYHKNNCEKEIVKNRRIKFRLYKDVFSGTDLCDWLLKAGLSQDRGEAETYGCKLLQGQIISHITGQQDFHDSKYLYKFSEALDYIAC